MGFNDPTLVRNVVILNSRRDFKNLTAHIQLFLIDEVHMLNEPGRGSTLEVIVSRMKTVGIEISKERGNKRGCGIRFMALSATAPNIHDVGEWLYDDQTNQPAQVR